MTTKLCFMTVSGDVVDEITIKVISQSITESSVPNLKTEVKREPFSKSISLTLDEPGFVMNSLSKVNKVLTKTDTQFWEKFLFFGNHLSDDFLAGVKSLKEAGCR